MKRVVICGSRDWDNFPTIEKLLKRIPSDRVIVTGGARGADAIANHLAKKMGFTTEVYKAEWDRYGKSAGHRRNEVMANLEGVTHVFAFRTSPDSRGTNNMIGHANRIGAYTHIVDR